MIGNNGAGIRVIAPQDHVTAGLTSKNEANTFERLTNFTA